MKMDILAFYRTSAFKTVVLLLVALALPWPACNAQQKEFKKWPAGSSPKEIGKRVAERFASGSHTNFNRSTPPAHITYPESVAWYGALTFAQLSGDTDLTSRLISRFDPLFTEESALVPHPVNVDSTIFGSVPLEIYIQTKQQKYLAMGLSLADQQWENPTPEGLTNQSRFWIDDMYMITTVQVQAYRATGDAKYIDRAALEMAAYLDKLQQPNGLFYHAPDVPFFWGRGNGWVAAGMAELLRSLPANHPLRVRIMEGYRKMMASLLRYQGKDGMWRQLLDHPEAWPESSCTAMFTFAMITGVKNGWLDEKHYGRAARKGWLGLVSYLDPNAGLKNVCEGTNKKNDLSYYLNRARNTGDLHGQAPLLWCASALLR
ncbi:MAG TPA: glycoside hydrolase family 88 protein [Candidatus Acidoferrum sp.]|nr:glycoside hydrolase family 88 protein [Candidatus Acidoferrum sp.]